MPFVCECVYVYKISVYRHTSLRIVSYRIAAITQFFFIFMLTSSFIRFSLHSVYRIFFAQASKLHTVLQLNSVKREETIDGYIDYKRNRIVYE